MLYMPDSMNILQGKDNFSSNSSVLAVYRHKVYYMYSATVIANDIPRYGIGYYLGLDIDLKWHTSKERQL